MQCVFVKYICMCSCAPECVYVHICPYIWVCLSVYMYGCIFACMCVYVCAHIHVCEHAYVEWRWREAVFFASPEAVSGEGVHAYPFSPLCLFFPFEKERWRNNQILFGRSHWLWSRFVYLRLSSFALDKTMSVQGKKTKEPNYNLEISIHILWSAMK